MPILHCFIRIFSYIF